MEKLNTYKKLNIYNGFGIKPTYSWTAAGMDFYIPYLKTDDEKERALKAFEKSYNLTFEEITTLINLISEIGRYSDQYYTSEMIDNNIENILMLYLGLYSYNVKYDTEGSSFVERSENSKVLRFMHDYLRFDKNGRPGILIKKNDTIFINSGIKMALYPNTVGVFFNKSGMGNKGFDVRAQVVDEDYSGYVHLSLAFTKEVPKGQLICCGDKASQMLILDIHHLDLSEIDENSYNEIMKDSKRGDSGFGSTDVK